MYISITYIDSSTKVLCTKEPMQTGPSFPLIKGLRIEFSDESTWPIATTVSGAYSRAPLFFGVCDDDATLSVEGFVSTYSAEDYASIKTAEHQARKPFPSWVGDEETMSWNPPLEMPTDGKLYIWDETTISWVEPII